MPQPPAANGQHAPATTLHRVEVSAAPGHADPIGASLIREAKSLGITLTHAAATHVYLIQPETGSPIDARALDLICSKLLADPITESARVGASQKAAQVGVGAQMVEVHPLPGVMDPVALSVQTAIQSLLNLSTPPQVSTGWRYDLAGDGLSAEQAHTLATRLLANPVIQKIHAEPYHPREFPHAAAHDGGMSEVTLIGLTDDQLTKLSRDAHLFLSLDEMQAVQQHYTKLKRNPREIELETLAQTWSEHCVHKTLKSTVKYKRTGSEAGDPINWEGRPGHDLQPDGSIVIHNLLKSTVAAATKKLIADGIDWTLSVFVDNSGVIAFDEHTAVCIKVETHNHPSAIEPYGGAATGVGGCIRDVIGTGLGARPIANTDVFCVAMPQGWDGGTLPEGCLHPRRILTQVVSGVRDYGNRMGIPTVNGAVYFDDRYIGNPLVYCGCIGVMPRNRVKGVVKSGDLIVALGGRTGRDGIHGATFSSAELEHTATDEFAHAVQIGNAITEKQTLDAIMRARDEYGEPLCHGLTDCGAGGFSSAVGEMGKDTGATVHLEKAPLKYAGLSATEIWISEAQERMVLAVPAANLDKLKAICAEESVDLAVLGTFAPGAGSSPDHPDLVLMFHGKEVGRLNMHFLHEGIPTPHREAVWGGSHEATKARSHGGGERSHIATEARSHGGKTKNADSTASDSDPSWLRGSVASSLPSPGEALLALLSHPNIASKHWIIRQYDHEVRGGTAIKPLVGPLSRGPSDASVICPVAGSSRGLAIACGLQTGMGDPRIGGDPYLMTLAAIDECVRNLVCVGADPDRIAILDNFCWPSCKKPENLATLVRAAEGCYDGAMAYRTPFVSGKDSLNNQFTTKDGKTIEIPPTLLITGIGIVPDIHRACTMDAKEQGNLLVLVGATQNALGGSHYQSILARAGQADAISGDAARIPTTDLKIGPAAARMVAQVIASGLARSAHDVSDGGAACAVAEMLIAGSSPSAPIGASLDLLAIARQGGIDNLAAAAFGESPSRYVLEVRPADLPKVAAMLTAADISATRIGVLDASGKLKITGEEMDVLSVETMAAAWRGTLDW